jgi:hypothetical protein
MELSFAAYTFNPNAENDVENQELRRTSRTSYLYLYTNKSGWPSTAYVKRRI